MSTLFCTLGVLSPKVIQKLMYQKKIICLYSFLGELKLVLDEYRGNYSLINRERRCVFKPGLASLFGQGYGYNRRKVRKTESPSLSLPSPSSVVHVVTYNDIFITKY